MALPRKPIAAAVSAPALINFGSLSDYAAGGPMLPEGDYLLSDFTVMIHQLEKKTGEKVGQPGLFVRVTCEPPTGATKEEEQHLQYYSMGGAANDSFAPDPTTGKGLVAKAGGKGGQLSDQSNWAFFLKSLYDAGLPEGIFVNDLSVLDGVQVHVSNVPEPESRKTMAPRTGEVATEERKNKTIPVVTEIKDGGAPWEGGGGPIAEAAPAKPALLKKPPVAATATAGKPNGAALLKKKAAPPPPADDTSEEQLAFSNAVAAVLEKNSKGMPRMGLRTATFRALKETVGDDAASQLTDAFFASDESLTAVLNELGFTLTGSSVTVLTD